MILILFEIIIVSIFANIPLHSKCPKIIENLATHINLRLTYLSYDLSLLFANYFQNEMQLITFDRDYKNIIIW